MKARDVMSTAVLSVTPNTSIENMAKIMEEYRISGLPVVDACGKLVGMVTEGDCLHRVELGTERKRSMWRTFLATQGTLAEEYIRSHARTVADVMTRDPVSVEEDTSLEKVIHLMEMHRIKRMPVLREGVIVGIVSRANLVQALAGLLRTGVAVHQDDIAIRDNVRAELDKLPWPAKEFVSVTVKDGVVDLWGSFTAFRQDEAAVIAAQNVAGVQDVRNHLAWVDPMSGLVVYSADEKRH
jgi:CBS domain-containing protein